MGKNIRVKGNKLVITASTILVITLMLTTPTIQAFATPTQDQTISNVWQERAKKALKKSRHAIAHAMDVIVEQAGQGENVTLAKNVLKASIRIYGAAERFFGEGKYRKAFLAAVLSALVARDSIRIANEGPDAVNDVFDEVGDKLEEVEELIEEMEESGDNLDRILKVFSRAQKLYEKAEGFLGDQKNVRGIVATEMSRILAHIAEKLAMRSQPVSE
ncbi:MAG: hypothetical protein ACE5GD_00530 [Candidatus Geothermarchaeales archaeon]